MWQIRPSGEAIRCGGVIMKCRKCGGQNAYCNGCGADSSGYTWETWFCPDCGNSHTVNRKVSRRSKSVTTELLDEIVINGVKYRKVGND